MTAICALASARVRSCARRPTTVRYIERRLAAVSASNDNGAQSWAPIGKSNPSGAMPTTSYAVAVDLDAVADNRPIAGKAALPETVAENHPPFAADLFLVGPEAATDRRLDAERREEVGGDVESLDLLRLVAADQIGVPPVDRGEPLEHVRLLLQIEEVGRRDRLAAVDVVLDARR